ncbi:MAG: proteasome subunit alpha, partial [Candidatus Altiarchaeales archaeon]|nr:proteasome subunit alpha [Candidatus Altiarchaeales archaeon]
CDVKQAYTQYGGARPFGTALLIAGLNKEPHLFETDPSGAFTEYTATSIGMGKRDVEKVFEERYKDKMNRKDAIDLALIGLNSVSEGKLKKENIDMVVIEPKKYLRITTNEIGDELNGLKKELEVKKKKTKEGEEEEK